MKRLASLYMTASPQRVMNREGGDWRSAINIIHSLVVAEVFCDRQIQCQSNSLSLILILILVKTIL